jgi:hypothetical protein
VPLVVGFIFVRAAPLAVYPVPETSLVAEYAVVAAPKVAELVYSAKLKVLPPLARKLCLASISSCLKDVHIAVVIAIIDS